MTIGRRPGFLDELAASDEADEATHRPQSQPAEEVPLREPDGPQLLDIEIDVGGRIDHGWTPEAIPARKRTAGPWAWIGSGILVLLLTWLGLSISSFIEGSFHRSHEDGAVATAGCLIAAGLLAFGCLRELRSYGRLRRVDELRLLLSQSDGPLEAQRQAAAVWVEAVGRHLPAGDRLIVAIRAANDAEQLRALLSRDACPPLRLAAHAAGRRAALQGGALVAVAPAPALEGAIALWMGVGLVRQVAQIYGIRPDALVTLSLLRRVAFTAAGVSGVALLSQTLAEHTLHKVPVIRHLAGALPETSLTAIRLYRLASIAAAACTPIPENE